MTTPADHDHDHDHAHEYDDDLTTPVPARVEVHAADSAHVNVAERDQYVVQVTAAAPTPVTALRTLPRDVAAFTGRRAEVEQLLATARTTQVVAIHTIDGMPGVGKTALAVHAARRLTGEFPDGQLFVRLHAHTPGQSPADPADVLAALLLGIGIDAMYIPSGLEARAGLWRDRLTGRRMLLVLDDAAGPAQVEPLLPGAEGCLVIVTSRRRLVALEGATPLPLDTLPPRDAALLFTRLAHRTPADVAGEEVAGIVRLCGHLPLAIALLAGRFAHHPQWDLAEYAREFAATQDRLGELAAGDRAVAAAFDLSYRALPPQRQRLFRSLGLHPGPDTDSYGTAAVGGVPLATARRALEALYEEHLVDQPVLGRYRLHDLIRAYARTLAEQDAPADREQAVTALLDYYQHTAQSADYHLTDTPRTAVPPGTAAAPTLASYRQAVAWMRAERANLISCTHYAIATAQHPRVIQFTISLTAFLRQQGPWDEAVVFHQAAAATSRGIGYRFGEAHALWALGRLRTLTGEYAEAAGLLEEALDLIRADGYRLGEAGALWALGRLRTLTGEYAAAAGFLSGALDLFRIGGFRRGEGGSLWALGRLRTLTGEYAEAAGLLRQALELHHAGGYQQGEADALQELGRLRTLTGEYAVAAGLLQQALDLMRPIGYRHGEADALRTLGRVRHLTGDHRAAADLFERSRILFKDLGDIQGEAEVRNLTGALLAEATGPDQALTVYREALRLARHVHSPLDEAHALEGAARCRVRIGERQAALVDLREAVRVYQRLGAAEASTAGAYLSALDAQGPDAQGPEEAVSGAVPHDLRQRPHSRPADDPAS